MSARRLEPHHLDRLTLDTEPWLSCDGCFALVDRYIEELLAGDLTAQPEMRSHLRGCPACAEEAVTLAVLTAEETGQDPTPALTLLER